MCCLGRIEQTGITLPKLIPTAMPIRLELFANSHYAAARVLWQSTNGVGLSDADSEPATAQFLARNPGTSYVALDDTKLVAIILVGHDGRRRLSRHLAA